MKVNIHWCKNVPCLILFPTVKLSVPVLEFSWQLHCCQELHCYLVLWPLCQCPCVPECVLNRRWLKWFNFNMNDSLHPIILLLLWFIAANTCSFRSCRWTYIFCKTVNLDTDHLDSVDLLQRNLWLLKFSVELSSVNFRKYVDLMCNSHFVGTWACDRFRSH